MINFLSCLDPKKNTNYLKKYLYVNPFLRTTPYSEFWFYKNTYPNLYTVNRVFHTDTNVTNLFQYPYINTWNNIYESLISTYGVGTIESGYHKKSINNKDIPDILRQKNLDPREIVLESIGTITHKRTHKYIRIFTVQKVSLFGKYHVVDFELFSGLVLTSSTVSKEKLLKKYNLDRRLEIEILTNQQLLIKPYIDCIHQLSLKSDSSGIN